MIHTEYYEGKSRVLKSLLILERLYPEWLKELQARFLIGHSVRRDDLSEIFPLLNKEFDCPSYWNDLWCGLHIEIQIWREKQNG